MSTEGFRKKQGFINKQEKGAFTHAVNPGRFMFVSCAVYLYCKYLVAKRGGCQQ